MSDDLFVIDAVTHSYDHTPKNFADIPGATAITELAYGLVSDPPDPKYGLPREVYLSDWYPEDLAAMLFHESETDVAIMHPLAISAFKDGYVSVEKAAEAQERWPNRFIGSYATVDPFKEGKAVEDLERQVEILNPIGLKLYPTSWANGKSISFRLDDPKLAYPLYEKAAELGLDTVGVHKAVPLGPVVAGEGYNPTDMEDPAQDFPDMTFEIVHGGLAFLDETAWMLARFGNMYVNMEMQNLIVERHPRGFAEVLLGLCRVGGPEMLKRLFWGTGTALHHPRPCLEAFLDFEFPEDLLENAGLFGPIPQITWEDKLDIAGRNYAGMHGIDIEAARKAIANDEFSRAPSEAPAEPYTTISKAEEVKKDRLAHA